MNPSFTRSVALACLAAGAGGILSSCVIEPPVTTYEAGYVTSTLPPGYRSEWINGVEYYTYNGNYYRPRGSSGYVVVESPHLRPAVGGEVRITTLPSGYRVVTRSGVRYYQVNDSYYQRRGDYYVVVPNPF